ARATDPRVSPRRGEVLDCGRQCLLVVHGVRRCEVSAEAPRAMRGAAPVAPGLPATGTAPGRYRGAGLGMPLGANERSDGWWVKPLAQALGLAILLGYANWAAFLGFDHYHYVENGRDYLSPFYSPYIKPGWLPGFISPALLILIFPLGFRA